MFEFVVSSPSVCQNAALAVAASRAGALGIVDLQFTTDDEAALGQLARVSASTRGGWGVHVDEERLLSTVLTSDLDGLAAIVVSDGDADQLSRLVERVAAAGLRALAVATCLDQALAAQAAGADAVIAKGYEAGGWVGEEGSFVLLQRLVAKLPIPVWVHGGIGLHTVAAAYASGAAGALLDSQLLLARESRLPEEARAAVASMDGSETTTFGTDIGAPVRVYARPGLEPLTELRELQDALGSTEDSQKAWREAVKAKVGDGSPQRGLLVLGQDAAFAADLAARFSTVAGIVAGLRDSIRNAREVLASTNPLSQGASLAQSHGTRFPIVQGPMTRVSDRAEFAAAVSKAGALPFLALALMRAPEADALLARTRELNGDRPWGVGVLGFVPPELRAEQLKVVRAHRPPFALIAGGRPDQARQLENDGITTYLHVPSPGLLKLYLADGARRFVFEGRECGGHVGPRTSFVLWDTMLRVLLEELPAGRSDCHVLFAGGIHDARSAAMVAAAAAAATERGVRIGVLVGTAYLFTREATECGAITPTFQDAAIRGSETVLLESGPGHATRCLPSPFVEQFADEKRRLRGEGVAAEELRARLEQLNVGRLRVASKGADRNPRLGTDPDAPKLVDVEPTEQWERGMYMIGQVAALRDRVNTLEDLHDDLCSGSSELLEAVAPLESADATAPPPADIAIIGLGCILPGAPDVAAFWANILEKVDAIREVPIERWDWHRMFDPDPTTRDKVYSRWGGFVEPVLFDPMAIGLPPKSLASIEPFQLLALVTAQAALYDAGYQTRPFDRDRTSVILGAGGGGADLSVGYTVRSALPSLLGDGDVELQGRLYDRLPEWTEDSFAGLLMNVAAGRIANRLDLGGTNYTVDAACASSLAAISLGVRELQAQTSEMVLAGGVDAIQNPFAYLCFSKTRALSPRGRCRPFDASADGIAISEGFATVALKRLADAERDGDRIYAVIRGAGSASDGRDRSLTAPRPEGQMRALRRAYAQAGFTPSTVGLVEAHGTGTVAGDGAEVQALSTVFAEHCSARQWCAIGSVKSMIGHTKATAGVAGVIKAALALHHRVLPPTIGVTEPNPKANFPDSPFYVNSEARPWLTGGADHPRRAAASAFGFGGTDFHLVLEEYTGAYLHEQEPAVDRWPAELLLWRGTRAQIEQALGSLGDQLAAGAEPRLADLALTLALDLPSHADAPAALGLVVESLDDLRHKLEAARQLLAANAARLHAPDGMHWAERPLTAEGSLAFLFPGQGSQFVGMARELAIAFPEARNSFELADRVLAESYDQPLSRYIFPPPSFNDADAKRREQELTNTHVAQPALGATELAYVGVLETLGIEPDMTAGHSYGEFVALAAAGGLDQEQLLTLSEARGRFMREAAAGESGAMAAVDAAPDALEPLLADTGVVAANLNGPRQTVISGPRDRVEAAVAWCREHDFNARTLPVACAFHSPHVAGAQRRLGAALRRAAIAAPRIPVYSNTTGNAHAPEPAAVTKVLRQHLVKPVEFVREIESMYEAGARVFVEVGPRAVLTGLTDQILGDREHVAVAVDRPARSGLVQLLHCLAALAVEGVPVRHERLLRGRRAKRLNVKRLADECRPAANAGMWLIDGGRARPASQPTPAPASQSTPAPRTSTNRPEEQPVVMSTSTTDAPPPVIPAAATSLHNGNGVGHLSPRVQIETGMPRGDRAADVVGHYHRVMQQFLETERDIMLGFLGTARTGAGADQPRAIPALPSPRAASLPPATNGLPADAEPVAPEPVAPVPEADAGGSSGPAQTAGNGHTTLTRQEIQERLLSVVSERTGYPAEMLSLDADMEGDLGMDSIKRVEIAGTFTQGLDEQQRALFDIERLTASRTLGEVIGVLEAGLAASADATPAIEVERPFEPRPVDQERIGRYVVDVASAPAITATAGLAAHGAVVIVDDETGLGDALARALPEPREAVLLLRGSVPRDEIEAAKVAARLREEHGGIKALVHLPAADEQYGGLTTLFLLAAAMRADLAAAADAGGAAVLGVTRLGGAFGVAGGSADGPPGQRAVAGFLKTLAQEWPTVRVKAVDLSVASVAGEAQQLLSELQAADGLVEVGYRDGERTLLTVVPAASAHRPDTELIDTDCVLLMTGGARGITAEVGVALAERYRPTLLLVGRTPIASEPPDTEQLTDPADLRRALIEKHRRAGGQVTPALVEEDCRLILRAREARSNLARMRAAGARVEYLECDVRDQQEFAALLDRIYEKYGRIDGVVHGAGVIEDRLVADKRRDSLERVIDTKAGSAYTLAQKLRPDGLRFVVLFGSVSGRFGNRGQADYAAACEALAELARDLDRRWAARIVSIAWGPWSGVGMVSPALEQEFGRRGVKLIAVEEGCRLLRDELARGHKGEVEVVIGATTGLAGPQANDGLGGLPLLAQADGVSRGPAGGVELLRTFSLGHDRYLDDHRVDGEAVLPFAVAMELMSESASLTTAGTPVAGLNSIRLLKGISVPDEEAVTVRIVAKPLGDRSEIEVTIGAADGSRSHYRSVAKLGDADPLRGDDSPAELVELAPFPYALKDAYRELLFHGPLFQGISAVHGMDQRGASAQLCASAAGACVAGADGLRWLLDPVLLDSALQVQVLWARLQWDVTLLPAEIGSYRRFADVREGERVRHELRIRAESEPPLCHADHWLLGSDGQLIATLGDVVGVGTQALNRLSGATA